MYAEIKVYDHSVQTLLKAIDKKARGQDAGKYGLPPKDRSFESLVYSWLYNEHNKYQKEKGS